MRLLRWLAARCRRRSWIMLALVPLALVWNVSYWRRSRSVPPVIVVCCVDKRYADSRLAAQIPAGYCWRWPGCAKGLVDDPERRELFFRDVERLQQSGLRFEKIVLVDHCDCKGYGEEDSREKHCECLRWAAALIKADARVANLPVELWLHDLEQNRLEPVES